MEARKYVIKQSALILAGQAVCVAVMFGIYALLGRFDTKVLLGGIIGAVLATLNFFFMAVGVSIATQKAQNQDVKGGKATVSLSQTLRLIVLAVVLFACIKSGYVNLLAILLPLVFTRPILSIVEFFKKPKENAL